MQKKNPRSYLQLLRMSNHYTLLHRTVGVRKLLADRKDICSTAEINNLFFLFLSETNLFINFVNLLPVTFLLNYLPCPASACSCLLCHKSELERNFNFLRILKDTRQSPISHIVAGVIIFAHSFAIALYLLWGKIKSVDALLLISAKPSSTNLFLTITQTIRLFCPMNNKKNKPHRSL